MSSQGTPAASPKRLVWAMVAIMIASFCFGIAMFLPAEHRAEILAENMHRYQARNPDAEQVKPEPLNRIRFSVSDEER
jgi:hypothetical protein